MSVVASRTFKQIKVTTGFTSVLTPYGYEIYAQEIFIDDVPLDKSNGRDQRFVDRIITHYYEQRHFPGYTVTESNNPTADFVIEPNFDEIP